MNASILCVGTELLFGQIVNTNAAWLSSRLQELGISVMYHYTVGDNPGRLEKTLSRALEETDIVITSGGLGPTQDDLTKEVIAQAMGAGLILDEASLEQIDSFFKGIGREMTENNRKQAFLPEGATILRNEVGTAPGFALEKEGKLVIALPGPPGELKPMFETGAVPILETKSEGIIYYRLLRFYGIGESALETKLQPLIDGQTDPTLATYAKDGECSLRIASMRPTKEEAEKAVADMQEKVEAIVGKYLYSDADEDLPLVITAGLRSRGMKLVSAESCTGGLFISSLIDIPGSSDVVERGFVTYSNDSKTDELDVPVDIIEKYGAVSAETVEAMAKGALRHSHADIAVAVSGVAGPDGGTEEKPAGLAWIAVACGNEVIIRKFMTRNRGRNRNRRMFVMEMMNQVNRVLNNTAEESR